MDVGWGDGGAHARGHERRVWDLHGRSLWTPGSPSGVYVLNIERRMVRHRTTMSVVPRPDFAPSHSKIPDQIPPHLRLHRDLHFYLYPMDNLLLDLTGFGITYQGGIVHRHYGLDPYVYVTLLSRCCSCVMITRTGRCTETLTDAFVRGEKPQSKLCKLRAVETADMEWRATER